MKISVNGVCAYPERRGRVLSLSNENGILLMEIGLPCSVAKHNKCGVSKRRAYTYFVTYLKSNNKKIKMNALR